MTKRATFEITKHGSTKNTQNTKLIAASSHAQAEDGKRAIKSMYKRGRKNIKRSIKKQTIYDNNIPIIPLNDFQAKTKLMHINKPTVLRQTIR
jgi:hypothetical protein